MNDKEEWKLIKKNEKIRNKTRKQIIKNKRDDKKLERKLVKAPAKEKLDLLKRCSRCIFVSSCIFMPESEECKNLINSVQEKEPEDIYTLEEIENLDGE